MKFWMILLAGFLILWGLSQMIPAMAFSGFNIILGVIALIDGILILIDK